jgi:hypothetical protein
LSRVVTCDTTSLIKDSIGFCGCADELVTTPVGARRIGPVEEALPLSVVVASAEASELGPEVASVDGLVVGNKTSGGCDPVPKPSPRSSPLLGPCDPVGVSSEDGGTTTVLATTTVVTTSLDPEEPPEVVVSVSKGFNPENKSPSDCLFDVLDSPPSKSVGSGVMCGVAFVMVALTKTRLTCLG